MSDRYLIHVGAQDKVSLLWQLELFHYSYEKYIDKSRYDVMYSVTIPNELPCCSTQLERMKKRMPIVESEDCSHKMGYYDPLMNKYLTILDNVLPILEDRHLIVMDSDIILLPLFNDWWRLLPQYDVSFEVNGLHRDRVMGFLQWYTSRYDCFIRPDDCLVAPCFILRNTFARKFLTEYIDTIYEAPDKRAAMMCGKGAVVARHKYSVSTIPQFAFSGLILDSPTDIYRYTNIHYYDSFPLFNKRMFVDHTPFNLERPQFQIEDEGYPVSDFIWNLIEEYVKNGKPYSS